MVLVIVVLGVLIWRRQLFENAFNRKATGLMLLAAVALVVSRVVGVVLRMPAPLIFTQELLMFAAVTATAAILMLRWLVLLALVYLACAYGCVLHPSLSAILYSLGTILMPPLSTLAVWKHRLAEERQKLEAIPESVRLE
jgi:uncharacterized membrane protein